jgi:hypothetical protein
VFGKTIFLLHDLEDIADRVSCCLLLHNMLVTDRVMDSATFNFRQRYDPLCDLEEQDVVVNQPADLADVQNSNEGEQQTGIGVADAPLSVQQLVSRADRFNELKNKDENQRLHGTLMELFGK